MTRKAGPQEAGDRASLDIVKGHAMAVMDYRTQDGLADYGFSIEFQSDTGWRIYIIFESFCQSDDDCTQIPYQTIDHNGRRYVNWSAKLDSLGDAKTVAALWAEITHRYQYAQEQRKDSNHEKASKGSQFTEQPRQKQPNPGKQTADAVLRNDSPAA
jgi:hypothetical protein